MMSFVSESVESGKIKLSIQTAPAEEQKQNNINNDRSNDTKSNDDKVGDAELKLETNQKTKNETKDEVIQKIKISSADKLDTNNNKIDFSSAINIDVSKKSYSVFSKKNIIIFLVVILLSFYIGTIFFGSNSLAVFLSLKTKKDELMQSIQILKKENSILHKNLLELRELEPKDYNKE